MPEVLEQMKAQANMLNADERAELASFLLESLEQAEDNDATAAWENEIARRVSEIRSGTVLGKPAEQVFAELRERRQ